MASNLRRERERRFLAAMEISEAKTPEPIPTRPSTVHRAVGVSVSVALLLGGHLLAFKASYSHLDIASQLGRSDDKKTCMLWHGSSLSWCWGCRDSHHGCRDNSICLPPTTCQTHTLMDMHTDLTAVPHASLGLKKPE